MTAEPPEDDGAVNATEACALPAAAAPTVGAPGATATTVNDTMTCAAARKALLPDWSALIVHVPADRNASAPPATVQTPPVDNASDTARPEVDVAASVGVVP